MRHGYERSHLIGRGLGSAHIPAVLYWNGPLQSGPLKARRTVCSVAPVSDECAAKYSGVEP
jgi:hypothetical protein